jgi:hypothetical protein
LENGFGKGTVEEGDMRWVEGRRKAKGWEERRE